MDAPVGDVGTVDVLDCSEPPGLLAHWTLDAADVQSSTVLDRSGNSRHGVLFGAPPASVGSGRVGEGLDFTATTLAWVEMAALPWNTSSGVVNTVSLWFWNDDPNVDDAIAYFPPGPGAQPPRYDLWLNFSRIQMVTLCINSGVSDCWGVSDPGLLGRWVHVVAVLANGVTNAGTLYVDGLDANASCRFGTCTEIRSVQNPFGLAGGDANYPFNGKLDDVRVFDRALTADEVARLYACAP